MIKIAYLVLAHRNPKQLERLCGILASDLNHVFLHIDRRMPLGVYKNLASRLCSGRIHMTKKRIRVFWGNVNLTIAVTLLMDAALSHAEKYDYFVLLSGQDYPIKSREELATYLEASGGKEYIKAFPFPYERWGADGGYRRIREYWLVQHRWLNALLRWGHRRSLIPERPFPFDMHPCGGGTWWMLTQGCVRYILEYVKANPGYMRYFRFSVNSAEYSLNTIVANSRFRDHIANHHLTYTDWTESRRHPKILRKEDFPALRSSQRFFARKFDIQVDSEILNLLDTINQ